MIQVIEEREKKKILNFLVIFKARATFLMLWYSFIAIVKFSGYIGFVVVNI